jgi:predicted GIY-YIG superfamily endonuclease
MVIVCVLEGNKRRRCVGITNDLPRRLAEHRSGGTQAGRLLGHFRVIHMEEHPDHSTARAREEMLKSGQGREWLQKMYPPGPACGG